MADEVQKGKTFAPFHYLDEFSYEDSLNYGYSSLSAGQYDYLIPILRPEGHKPSSPKKVQWSDDVSIGLEERHNEKPSKGNFYQSSLLVLY